MIRVIIREIASSLPERETLDVKFSSGISSEMIFGVQLFDEMRSGFYSVCRNLSAGTEKALPELRSLCREGRWYRQERRKERF